MTDVNLSIGTKRTPRQTRNQTPHVDDEITKNTKGKTWYMWKHLFRLKEKGKKDVAEWF